LSTKLTFKNFLIFAIFIFLFRLLALKIMKIDLFFDEAYYWYWSKHLAWGYYSKPPFIAFIIKIFTSIFGDNIYGVKIASNLFYTLSAIYVYLIFKFSIIFSKKEYKLLYVSGVPFLNVISLQALLERANANWALPTYIRATILVIYYLYQKSKKWIYIGIGFNVFLMLLIYFYHSSKQIINQFAISTNLNKYKHQNFLVLLNNKNINHIAKYFQQCKLIAYKKVEIYKDFSRKTYIYYCKNFKGY